MKGSALVPFGAAARRVVFENDRRLQIVHDEVNIGIPRRLWLGWRPTVRILILLTRRRIRHTTANGA